MNSIDLRLYSDYPIDLPPAETSAACSFGTTTPLILTPWTLDASLVGSVWRNVHTGTELIIASVEMDKWERWNAHPSKVKATWELGLGLWRNETFRVEHWSRIDHRTPTEQLPWMMWESVKAMSHYNNAMRQAKHYREVRDTANANSQEQTAQWYQKDAQKSREKALAFARLHNLVVTNEDINADATGQLVLF